MKSMKDCMRAAIACLLTHAAARQQLIEVEGLVLVDVPCRWEDVKLVALRGEELPAKRRRDPQRKLYAHPCAGSQVKSDSDFGSGFAVSV